MLFTNSLAVEKSNSFVMGYIFANFHEFHISKKIFIVHVAWQYYKKPIFFSRSLQLSWQMKKKN